MSSTETIPLPEVDPRAHLSVAELARRLRELPPSRKDSGRVALLVARPAAHRRTPLESALLSGDGMPGDRWARADDPEAGMQLATMEAPIAELIANGQPLLLFGDNLFVSLDLSSENLPTGTRLRAGGATLEVSPMPHDGCHQFRARFGADALRFVSQREIRARNLRGIYLRVVEDGPVRVGDPIEVLERP